jgi:hypothetical protein
MLSEQRFDSDFSSKENADIDSKLVDEILNEEDDSLSSLFFDQSPEIKNDNPGDPKNLYEDETHDSKNVIE